jgi:osmotically-inducible protein OsmY
MNKTNGETMDDAGPRPDDEVRKDVEQHLVDDTAVDAKEVRLSVKDGVVTLSGAVDAVPEKRRAREIAETIPGEKAVVDNMQVRNFVERGDEELKNEIINHLGRDAWVESLPDLEVYVSDGQVRLEGTPKTWPERSAIEDVVWWVPGVRDVENLMHPDEAPQDIVPDRTAFHNEKSL